MAMVKVNDNPVSAALLGIDEIGSICYPLSEKSGIYRDDENVDEDEEYRLQKMEELELDMAFGNIIVVYNVPKVPRDKIGVLAGVLHAIINTIINSIYTRALGRNQPDSILEAKNLWMPIEPYTTTTCGYYVIHCVHPYDSLLVMTYLNGYKLDKSHTLGVKRFDEFAGYAPLPGITNAPGVILNEWLTDVEARDQYLIRTDSGIEVLWNDASHLKPDLFYKRTYASTERQVQWSPLGTYLATHHERQGVAVWGSGGSTFNLLTCCVQPAVDIMEFSPGERFLVTYFCFIPPDNARNVQFLVLDIYDVRSGKEIIDLRGHSFKFGIPGPDGGIPWPVFSWIGGKDDLYFAHLAKDFVFVYDTKTFTLIDQTPIEFPNVMDISCSPADPIIALFVPQHDGGNQPATVSLVQIPSKEKVREEIILNTSGCKMFWQSNGDYLAVQVDRYTEETRSTHSGFVIFRIKELEMPIEVLELENNKHEAIAFAWEPNGHRFAVIHRDNQSLLSDVSFYSMRTAPHNTAAKVSNLATLKGMKAKSLYWSPAGQFIVLAGPNGQIVFYDVDKSETMATDFHFRANHIQWDPSGRYVATAVTCVDDMKNGYKIWSFNGKLLYSVEKDRLLQFSWRPRPPSLLGREQCLEDEDSSLLLSSLRLSEQETHGFDGNTGDR